MKNFNKSGKKKIWIVSEVFYPDQASTGYIMTAIAKHVSIGNDVHIICGPIGYDKFIDEKSKEKFNFKIHRINLFNFNKNNIIGRLFRMILLSIGMFLKGLNLVKKQDVVFIVTNPAFLIPFYALIQKIKKNKLIVLVHDVFPENLLPSKIINSDKNIFYKLVKIVFDKSYKKANLLIVLGEDMLEIMRRKTNKVQNIIIIENWSNIVDIKPTPFINNELVQKYNLGDKYVFTFAGNLGRIQGLEFLFKVIQQVKNSKIHFLFIGDGVLLKDLKNKVESEGIDSVTFTGHLSRESQNDFFNAAHFGLVTLTSDLYGLGVPSKTYNIMAAGKPILFIGNRKSEVSQMIIKENCGISFDESQETELLDFFNQFNSNSLKYAEEMGVKSRILAETKYSQASILNKFKAVLR